MTPLYIFDLDGTLALIDHRLHHVQSQPKNWRAFFAACVDDKPNLPVLETLNRLRKGGAEIWVWSGRSDEVREETIAWLHRQGVFHSYWNPFRAPEMLRMRKAGDYRDDTVVKREWAGEIEPPEWNRLTATFDDRDRVVAMWRDLGITCFQVAAGDF